MRAVAKSKERFSAYNRQKKVQFATEVIQRLGIDSVVFVGVNGQQKRAVTNAVELAIAAQVPRNVATGLSESAEAPFAQYEKASGLDLPFEDGSFDLVYSNAVIEHVGDRDDQRRFLEEHRRVGRFWIATTPNKAFPIESHSNQVMRHWARSWSHPTVSRLLTKADFADVVPEGGTVLGHVWSPTLTACNTQA